MKKPEGNSTLTDGSPEDVGDFPDMAKPVEFTAFETVRASTGQFIRSTFLSFCHFLLEAKVQELPQKLAAQLLISGKYKAGSKDKKIGSFEYNGGMLPYDYDNITEDQYAYLLQRISEEGHACLIYSTYGHSEAQKENKYKIRIIFLLSRKVYKHEFPMVWESVNQMYGGFADPKCKDPVHGYFVPSCPPGTPEKDKILDCYPGKAIVVDEQIVATRADALQHGNTFRRGGTPVEYKQVMTYARKLKRRGTDTGFLLIKMLEGLPFAVHGSRDEAVFKMCRDLAKEFPEGEAGSIAELFSSSLSQMPGDHPITVKDVQEKLERAQADLQSEKEAEKQVDIESFKKLQEATGVPEDYDAEYVQRWAEKTGSGSTFEVFKKRLIIAANKKYYAFFNGTYFQVEKDSLFVAFREYLYPTRGSLQVNPYKLTDSGKEVPKNSQELFDEYGTAALNVEVRLGISCSFYEEWTHTFVIAKCTPQITKAEYSEAVDLWMRKAAPSKEVLEAWRDWMAGCADLSKPLAMLVLLGLTGVGKTSFAEGIAKLWSTNYVPQDVMFDNFQDTVWQCPALYADEEFPKDFRGRVPSAKLRAILTSGEHQINKKNEPRMKTVGYFRLMAGLQNYDKLNDLSFKNRKADIDAIMRRVLVVDCNPEAMEYFDWHSFVPGGAIARHALWLRDQRQQAIQDAKARFGVREYARNEQLAVHLSDKHTHAAMEWMCGFLEERLDEDSNSPPAFVARGRLFYDWQNVYETWDRVFGARDYTKPDRFSLRDSLKTISTGKTTRIRLPSGKQRIYEEVNTDMLEAYVRSYHPSMDLQRELKLYSEAIVRDKSGFQLRGDLYPTRQDVAERQEAIRIAGLDLEPAAD